MKVKWVCRGSGVVRQGLEDGVRGRCQMCISDVEWGVGRVALFVAVVVVVVVW